MLRRTLAYETMRAIDSLKGERSGPANRPTFAPKSCLHRSGNSRAPQTSPATSFSPHSQLPNHLYLPSSPRGSPSGPLAKSSN
jgi:hypothetical protein